MSGTAGPRRWRRLALIWAPLLALAGGVGWVLVPSNAVALAAPPGSATTSSSTTSVPGAANLPLSPPDTRPVTVTTTPGETTTTAAPPTHTPSNGTPNHPTASQGTPVHPAEVAGNTLGADGVTARVLYQQDCAVCHGATGLGTPRAPSLKGVGEAAVDFELTTGRMPKKDVSSKTTPYSRILPEADILALDRYVTALVAHGGPGIPSVNPTAGVAAHGQELFDEDCAACHNWSGSGGILFDRPVPKITEASPTQLGEAMRIGPVAMPKFGPKELTSQQVNDIAAYLQEMKHPYDHGGDPISHLGPFAEGAVVWLVAMVAILFVTRWIGKRG